ncbi:MULTISPECIES: MFS transporter [Inquilinus]|uniref:MFS family permease n=1 Tax=Inquilinus ginsengisoli TaxID=363840 RepID=A0ABU1JNF6_9PROT|nr:MFS transporter [Inquilinus ginsengisoli]MDR6290154.1 MFS family permease [Inquilinus ginsengisoli]
MGTTAVDRDRLLDHPSFPVFWAARVLSALAFQMSAVAIGWLVYARTGSAYSLGLVGLFQFLPMVVLTLLVGHVADQYDRRRIVQICQLVEGLTLAVLAVAIFDDWLTIPGVFAAVLVLGAARAFEQPTMAALLPALVPAVALPRALAISSSAVQTATIIGPSLGGLLYAVGVTAPFVIAAVFFLAACGLMTFMRLQRSVPRREPPTLRSVFSGIAFIRSRPVILGSISLDMFAVLLGGATALLPIYAHDILQTGPWGLGLLRSAPAVGALTMSAVLTRVPLRRGVGRKMFAAVIVFGAATVVFAASTSLVVSLVALAVLGAADNVSVVIRSSLVQLLTPDEMRGRVSAVNSLFVGTSNQLGEFESGMAAGLLGAVPAGVLGGIGTIVIALLWMRLFPGLRKTETLSG